MITRRLGLAAAFMAVMGIASLPFGEFAEAQEKVKLRVALLPFAEVAPVYYAIDKGLFAEEGVEVETVPSMGGAASMPGLLSGDFQIIYSGIVTNILAAQKGLDIKVIGGSAHVADKGAGVVVWKDAGIKSGKDLEGKTMAVNLRQSLPWALARAWVKKSGGDPDKVTYKEIAFPQMADALSQKQVDAVYAVDVFYDDLASKSDYSTIGNPEWEIQPQIQSGQYVTSGAFLASNQKAIDGFLRAMKKANAWYDANRGSEEVAEVAAGFTGMTKELALKVYYPASYLDLNKEEFAKTVELVRDNGMLKSDVDLGKLLYTPSQP